MIKQMSGTANDLASSCHRCRCRSPRPEDSQEDRRQPVNLQPSDEEWDTERSLSLSLACFNSCVYRELGFWLRCGYCADDIDIDIDIAIAIAIALTGLLTGLTKLPPTGRAKQGEKQQENRNEATRDDNETDKTHLHL